VFAFNTRRGLQQAVRTGQGLWSCDWPGRRRGQAGGAARPRGERAEGQPTIGVVASTLPKIRPARIASNQWGLRSAAPLTASCRRRVPGGQGSDRWPATSSWPGPTAWRMSSGSPRTHRNEGVWFSVTAICDQQRVAEHAESHRRREPAGTVPACALSCGRSTGRVRAPEWCCRPAGCSAHDGADRLGRRAVV